MTALEKAKNEYYRAKAAYASTAFSSFEDQWAARLNVSELLRVWLKEAASPQR